MIYLINPSEKSMLDNAGDRVPIGLLSIAANLIKHKHSVKVYDMNHTLEGALFKDIEADNPNIIGISAFTSPMYPEVKKLVHKLKEYDKDNNIIRRYIAGGYHASAMPDIILEDFDALVIGEGENSFLTAMEQDGIIPQDIPDLNELPNPARYLLDMSKYGVDQSGHKTATLISSRGCPYECAFCYNYVRNTRFVPVDKMKQQIDEVINEGFESIYFLDDVFTLKKDRMEEVVKYVGSYRIPFRITTRANLVNDEKMKILAENGCEWISLGIESGDNYVLERSNKRMTIEDNIEAVKLANKYGIKVKGFFIIGLPGESEKSAKKTINSALYLHKHGLKSADFYFLSPFPGTPIWNNPEKFNIEIIDKDYTKYLQAGKIAHCYVNTEHLTAKRIEELVEEAKTEWNELSKEK